MKKPKHKVPPCMVAFYFFSLIPIAVTVGVNSYINGFKLNEVVPVGNLELFLKSLFFAPWFETLLLNVLLTKIFLVMKEFLDQHNWCSRIYIFVCAFFKWMVLPNFDIHSCVNVSVELFFIC